MSDWVTVTKKSPKEPNYSKNCNLPTINKSAFNKQRNQETNSSGLSFAEITDIFEDEYGFYIEDEIIDVCKHSKKYSDLLRNINACDIEYFFYDYINKEESIPQKYKEKPVENQEPEIYSDDDF